MYYYVKHGMEFFNFQETVVNINFLTFNLKNCDYEN